MAGFPLAEHTQRAHHATVFILDPQVHGLRLGIASIDIGIRAILFDDEDVLPNGEDPEQGPRRQLVEVSRVDLRHVRTGSTTPLAVRRPPCTPNSGEPPWG